ncbi:MAG TPA: S8 family serine peptidase [Anaerolineae bacterium]|nr:S8 family serine peptidase [Anaerolineae bacterium]
MKHLKFFRLFVFITVMAMMVMTLGGTVAAAPTMRVIVRGTSLEVAVQAVTANGGRVTDKIDIINAVVADVPQANVPQLARTVGVMSVMADRTVKMVGEAFCPPGGDNDSVTFDYAKVVGADQVWAGGNLGQGVTVATLDTGIDPTFVSLRVAPGVWDDRYLVYYDAIANKKYEAPHLIQSPRDPNGHGTHVAGIIGNSDKENGHYVGIAPGVNFVSVRVLDDSGMGTYANVLRGLNWVVQHKNEYNIRVLNMSMYAMPVAPYWADPYNLAVMAAWKAGIVVIASAGNGGPEPLSVGVPGNTPYIITVGAFTDNYTPNNFGDDYIPEFSAAGPTLDAFVKPDVIAPGAHMSSLMRNNSYLAQHYPDNRIRGTYFKMSGTSMSAATVSGIVALMLRAHPNLTPDQVKYRLSMTARPQFSEATGEMAYSIWQQGAGRVWAPEAVSTNIQGTANQGMDITADLAGTQHYEGYTDWNSQTGQFEIRGGGYATWSGGYATWSGGYASWSGGYASWSGGNTNWSGGYASWSGGYASWSGGYASWSGGYASWSGGYASWSGGYASWSGGYASWSGGYASWSGNTESAAFASAFANLQNVPSATATVGINNWVDVNE